VALRGKIRVDAPIVLKLYSLCDFAGHCQTATFQVSLLSGMLPDVFRRVNGTKDGIFFWKTMKVGFL
jgi:hypothetical protein